MWEVEPGILTHASLIQVRQDSDFFGDQDLSLVYIAKRLNDAKRLEELLTGRGLDYLVEPDTYTGGVIFRSQRIGAFFYVAPAIEETVRMIMAQNGYKPYDDGEA
jgi:hypothetical protein